MIASNLSSDRLLQNPSPSPMNVEESMTETPHLAEEIKSDE